MPTVNQLIKKKRKSLRAKSKAVALARGFNGLYEIAWVDPSGAVWHSSQGANGATVPVQLSTGALHVALLTVP